ncbi:ATP-binding cassette sub-family C member 4-like [Polistes fuscatus]|uniref:ATP-binding cassette sub-family C member 4-like n=1 Tax=Polistes fuscatus TaxID=30207 RepID=UPI001CA96F6A|nr:ATP-binding cassette sub-family C member 4-like [Polistes fuscatus]
MDSSKKYDNPSPRTKANIFSILIFWWLKPLFLRGKDHDLEVKDLYNARPTDISELLGDKLEKNWMEELKAAKAAGRKPKLFTALRKTFFSSFAFYGGWTLFISLVSRVLQPYTLGLLIWHFDPRATSTVTEAYLYATAVVVLITLTALIHHHTQLGSMEIGMRMRVACSSLVYRKILRLSQGTTSTTTSGQIINLLSNDVSRFEQLFIYLHYIWIMPLQGALIAFLIWESVGIASLAGVFLITIQTIPVQGYMSKWTASLRLKIAVRTDERVRLMTEIIRGIQIIKMYTWEKPFEKLVSLSRSYEIDVLTLTSYLRGFTLATFVFTERTTLYFTIMAYVLLGNNISADKVFSMAQYFNILQATMAIFYPIAVSSAAEALVSIKRLQNFLLLEENVPLIHALPKDEKNNIILKDITASWTDATIVNTLHGINTYMGFNKLYALVGPVGAGKSSFLQLILGELKISHGQIYVKGSISYASQESWLFSGTVRNNILFGQPYDPKKYQKVVKACALLKDFEQFPHGDKTLVGDRGAALSGGQRARINLARAVYRDADIYLLDDPLSAVDVHVGKHLFDECINGYLKNKTRILATHQIQYLKDCDHIIILNNGYVEIEGTFADIQTKKIDFLKLLVNDESKEKALVKENSIESASDVLSNTNTVENEEDVEPQETEELMAKGSISKAVYWKYFRAGASIFVMIAFFLSMILGLIGSSGSDYWVAYWTNQEEMRLKQEQNRAFFVDNSNKSVLTDGDVNSTDSTIRNDTIDNNITHIVFNDFITMQNITAENTTNLDETFTESYGLDVTTALWVYGGLVTLSIVMTSTRNLLFYKACMTASKNLHNMMFSCLLKAPMLFFNTNPFGRILNRFSKDIGAVDEVLPRTMIESIQIFTVMTGILAQVIIINWWSIVPMLIMGFLCWKIRNIYLATAQNLKRLEGTTKSPVFSHVNSSLVGLSTIRSTNAQEMLSKEFDLHQDLHTGAYSLSITTATTFGLALDAVSVLFVAFVTYSFIILNNGNTFAGNVGLAISQVLILCGMLQHGMRQTAEAIAQMTSVERVLQFTQLDEEGPFASDPNNKPSQEWPTKGEIKFDRVYLQYSNSDPPVLKNLNFIIQPAMKVGIVGRTGAGKSSLISALFRLSEFNGAIYIDGMKINKIGLHDLRNKISIIPQDPVLFSATLRDNLDPFNKHDDVALWTTLEEVELKSAFISLDHQISESGSNLSAGQRQLLCLARAIIENNKILILDEATANVDPATDTLIQSTIRRKLKNCTVLTIAHRLNTIMDSDRILLLDHGEILEFDHPYTLLKNEQSYFYKMAEETGETIMEQFKIISKQAYDNSKFDISTEIKIQENGNSNGLKQ